MTKSKRLLIAIFAMIYFGIVIFFGIYKNMENLAISCGGFIMTLLTAYVISETKRPSKGGKNET